MGPPGAMAVGRVGRRGQQGSLCRGPRGRSPARKESTRNPTHFLNGAAHPRSRTRRGKYADALTRASSSSDRPRRLIAAPAAAGPCADMFMRRQSEEGPRPRAGVPERMLTEGSAASPAVCSPDAPALTGASTPRLAALPGALRVNSRRLPPQSLRPSHPGARGAQRCD